MKMVVPVLLTSALAACTASEDPSLPPGLADPACTMTWRNFRLDAVTLPVSAAEATLFGLDLDQRAGDPNGGIDNQLGTTHGSLKGISESWDVNPAIAGHLAAGRLDWMLQVGTCPDGDEVRTRLGRGADRDGDGVRELVDLFGIPAVGTRGARVATAFGTARVPIGFLTDGRGDLATDAWQIGFAFATELWFEADGGLAGKVGFGLGPFSDAAIEPLRAYATDAIGATGTGAFWRDMDADHDGAISTPELRAVFDTLTSVDLDLGEPTEADASYRRGGLDGEPDHLSLGIAIHATPVEVE